MKHKNRFLLPILTLVTFGMVTGSVFTSNYASNEKRVDEAQAATSSYPNKMYLDIQSGPWEENHQGVFLYAWSGSDNIDVEGVYHGGIGATHGYTFLLDSPHEGWEYKIHLKKNDNLWYHESKNAKTLPGASSNDRWITWYSDYGIDDAAMNDLNRAISYNNGTVTCDLSGEYAGKSGEVVSREFAVTISGTIPTGKVAVLGQYSNSACTSEYLTNVFPFDGSSKTFAAGTFTFNSDVYFKPIFYDKHYISYDAGTSWNELTTISNVENHPTDIQFSTTFTNKPAGTLIRYKHGSTEISSIKFDATSNLVATETAGTFKLVHAVTTPAASAYLKVTTDGTYHTYVSGIPTQAAGQYFLNVTTGDIYHCTYHNGENIMDDAVWFNVGDKVQMFNSDGANNTFYATAAINSQTLDTDKTFKYSEDNDGNAECLIADYYKLYKQTNDTINYNILYAGICGANLNLHYNGKGGTDDTVRVCQGDKIDPSVAPTNPVAGYVLAGWYTDSSLETEWDFDVDTVAGDMNLYAKWSEDVLDYTVVLTGSIGVTIGIKDEYQADHNIDKVTVTKPVSDKLDGSTQTDTYTSSELNVIYAGINAAQMTDNITIKLYRGSDQIGPNIVTCIANVLENKRVEYATAGTSEKASLCAAIMVYGGYVQLANGYNTSNLAFNRIADSDVLNDMLDELSTKTIASNPGDSNITDGDLFTASNISISAAIGTDLCWRLYFECPDEDVAYYSATSGRHVANDGKPDNYTISKTQTYRYFEIDDIKAYDVDAVFSITVNNSDNSKSSTITYSVKQYLYNLLQSSSVNATYKNLAKAILLYRDYAVLARS